MLAQPISVRAFMVPVQIIDIEVASDVTQVFDDGGVSEAIEKHLIDSVADRFGEPGDFSLWAISRLRRQECGV